jgi:hypothetical protein
MTIEEPTAPSSPRPRTLQDDLLADLRQAAPMPIPRFEADPSASLPADRSQRTDAGTPTVHVSLTPRRWSAPSLRPGGAGSGFVVTAGPVRVSITGFGR